MNPGAILFHKQFVFADGASADKYLVVLANAGGKVLAAKTTSNGKRYRNDHGCQSGSYFAAFLLTAGCCCLPKSTWVCFNDFYELDLATLQQRVVNGDVRQFGALAPELTRDLLFCAASTDDISAHQEALVRAHLAATAPDKPQVV